MRLVDADEVYKVLTDYYHHKTETQHEALKEALSKVPTVDAEPVKHGHWINANEGLWNTVEVLKCSVCGEMDNRMDWSDSYCPNCGRKMDEVEDG